MQDLQDECAAQVRAAEARANIATTEAQMAMRQAEDTCDAALRDAARRVGEAEERATVAEQRAETERERARQAQQRFDELLAAERTAAEVHCAEMHKRCLQVQEDSDKRVAEMQVRLTDAQRRAERAEADAVVRTQEAQKVADIQIVEAKAGKWRAIEAVKSQCCAQTDDIIDRTTRAQAEAQHRVAQVQANANERIEMEKLRAQTTARILTGGLLHALPISAAAEEHVGKPHDFRVEPGAVCMICPNCLSCTGYGSSCPQHDQERSGRTSCGCGDAYEGHDAGCRFCGICYRCAETTPTCVVRPVPRTA